MKPWRSVVHIETQTSKRKKPAHQRAYSLHAQHWLLTLSCGHLVVRDVKPFTFAPNRVRCSSCG